MNKKRTLTRPVVLVALLLGGCGDDNASPKEQLEFAGKKVSLKEANLFLADEGAFDGGEGVYREYIITDAERSGNGATFYIEIELGNPDDDVLKAGKYPVYDNWGNAPEGSNISYVSYDNNKDNINYVELYASDDGVDDVEISGGFNDGETMTIKFKGKLTYYHYDSETEEWVEERIDSKIYFKGEVDDAISIPAKIGKVVRGKR